MPSADTGVGTEITIRAVRGEDLPVSGLNVYTGATPSGTTDASGELTLTFTPGTAITVEFAGSEQTTYTSLASIGDAVPRDGDVIILPVIVPRVDQDLVTLIGTITNAPSATIGYVLNADAPGAESNLANGGVAPDFEITLPRQEGTVNLFMGTGEATPDPRPSPRGFDRTVGAIGAITSVDATMDQADVVVDVDVDGVTLVEYSGSFTVPSGDAFFDAATANVLQRSQMVSGSSLGGVTRIYFDDTAGALLWEAVRVPVEPALTEYILGQGPRFSVVVLSGDASGDQGEIAFLAPPNVTAPAFGEAVSPGGQVAMDNVPEGTFVALLLNNGDDVLWAIISSDESAITIPELPAGSTVLVGDNVRYRPRFCTLGADSGCDRYAFGPAVDAAP